MRLDLWNAEVRGTVLTDKGTLDDLVPYPVTENGLSVGVNTPFARPHRHWSHMLMVHPLHVMDFDSRNPEVCATVFSEFASHLERIGFSGSAPPSEMDSWAGLHNGRSHRIWFVRSESNSRKKFVYVDLEKTAVRTSIKREVYGTHRKAQLAKQDAYRLALALDDWFAARKEANELPQKFRDEKRQGFNKSLATNQAI